MKEQRLEALVLRAIKLSEADRLIVVFTRERGKLRLVAKGARLIKAKLAGLLMAHQFVSLQVVKRNQSRIVGARLIEDFSGPGLDLQTLGLRSLLAEIVDRMAPEEVPNQAVFDRLVLTFRRLNRGKDGGLVLGALLFMSASFGFGPDFKHCPACGRELLSLSKGRFGPPPNGLTCLGCQRGGTILSQEKILNLTNLTSGRSQILDQALSKNILDYIYAVLDREPKSAGFLRAERRLRLATV